MSKTGRNSICPCGSGKKYKKCCIDKPDQVSIGESVSRYLNSFWEYEEVNEMKTGEIIQRLESMGIMFNADTFIKEVEEFYSAEQLSENWFKKFKVVVKGRDEDFPFFATWILWERLAPAHILSMEQMSDLIEQGYKYSADDDSIGACDIWFKVWDALKYRFKPEFRNMDFLDKQYKGSFFMLNICQDLEHELYNAGLKDKVYFDKRINYCREFISYFPDERELLIHNMRRTIAESYINLNNYEQAEFEYEKLVQDYPDNPWGYIGWGDMYYLEKDKNIDRAKELYEKASALVRDDTDEIALEERLADLEEEERAGDH